MNPQTEQRRGRLDPTAIFENQGRASDQPTQAQVSIPRAHTEVVSSSGDLVSDDPSAIVEAVVRPHHNYGGMPAGTAIKLPFREFDGHRAALCSRAEYVRITALQASPDHQARQRQLADMRAATTDAFYRGLSQEKRAELDAARRRAAADDEKEDARRTEIAAAAAAAQPPPPAAAAPGPQAIPTTAAELEVLIGQRRQATEQAAAGALPRVAERLRELFTEEEIEIRGAFLAAQEERARTATRAQELAEMAPVAGTGSRSPVVQTTVEERLRTLAGLFERGLITAEVYQARQTQIVEEV